MSTDESRTSKIIHLILKIIVGLVITYLAINTYVLPFYLKDHYETTTGTIIGVEQFENGGDIYRYKYKVEDVEYSATNWPVDRMNPPKIGAKCQVKYIPFLPWVSTSYF